MGELFCSESFDDVIENKAVPKYIDVAPLLDQVLLKDERVLENMLNDEINNGKIDYCGRKESLIAPHMRKIVTDWMLEVCEDQQCQPEVFFLAVNYLDRYLSLVNIAKNQLQLVASTCLLLASKFSQVVPLSTEQLVIYTDNSVTVEELRQMEINVLNALQWELSSVTAHSFLEHLIPGLHLSSKVNIDKVKRNTDSIMATAATEYQFMLTKPSLIASAALAIVVKETSENLIEDQEIEKILSKKINCDIKELQFYITSLQLLLEPYVVDQSYLTSSCHVDDLPSSRPSIATAA